MFVQAYTLEAAIDDFAPAVGPATLILPVLNGMSHIDTLTRRFGEGPVIGGVCWVATELDGEGNIVQIDKSQSLTYGERTGQVTPRLEALDATLRDAGFDARLSTDITQEMWEKWVALASLGAITCLMRGAIGEIVAAPGGAEQSLKMLNECAAIAAACGHPPPPAFLSRFVGAMTAPGSALTSSMFRDLRRGAAVEVDQIVGDLLERGNRSGTAAPLLAAAFVNLKVYQAALSSRTG